MSTVTNNNPVDTADQGTVPYLPVQPPAATPAAPAHSEELRAEIERIQTEEQVRIDREKQAELARWREVARFD